MTTYHTSYRSSWALVIGINKYQHISPLGYARQDAEGVAATLKARFGFPDENVILLVDEAATRDAIMSAFLTFTRDEIDPDDRLLVFFAGHGYTQSGRRGEVGFLIPVDGDPRNLATLIRWDELTRNGELVPAKHLLYLMDACYGGLAVTRQMQSGNMRFLKDMLQRYSRQVLTAGKADEVVADAGGPRAGHSVFTGHLLDALDGAAAQHKGVLTANSVMAYVYDKVGRDQFSNQTPHFGFLDGDGDFVFDLAALESLSDDPQFDADILIPSILRETHTETVEAPSEVDLAKEYLADSRFRIKLHDLMFSALRNTATNIGDDSFPLDHPEVTAEVFASRLRAYEESISPMQEMYTLLCTWAETREQLSLAGNLITQLAPTDLGSGKTVWIGMRWYPALLALYSGGIGALSQDNYAVLGSIFQAPIGNDRIGRQSTAFIQAVADGWLQVVRTDIFKMLPEHERQYVPDKEYLFKVVQPVVEDLLFLGKRYESLFDRFEVLLALVHAEQSFAAGGNVWGPIGRFGWKYNHHAPNDPLSEIITEAEQAKDEWPPIQAGLFRSYENFRQVADPYRERISRLSWF